jgi:hypothetical protein
MHIQHMNKLSICFAHANVIIPGRSGSAYFLKGDSQYAKYIPTCNGSATKLVAYLEDLHDWSISRS